jgi:hypothetical protein
MSSDSEYSEFLEQLRQSGKINMFGAAPYLMSAFGLPRKDAIQILCDWMENYDRNEHND